MLMVMEKFKKSKLESLNSFIKELNFAKITDRKIRTTFIKLIPAVSRALNEFEEDKKKMFETIINTIPEDRRIAYDKDNMNRNELFKKFQDSQSLDDWNEFAKVNDKFNEDYKEIIEAVNQYQEAVNSLADEEVEFSVDSIDANDFVDAMTGLSEITTETFDLLYPIVKTTE